MTPEKAIEIIKVAKAEIEWSAPLEYQEALGMAIEALREQKEKNSKELSETQKPLDTISRAAAIDALHMDTSIIPFKKAREYADATISEIRNRLEKLPSAQPELPPYVAEIEAEYQKAVKAPYIRNPLAKALYEVWKKYDR